MESRADRRSDIWALGVLTYEMLTGHAPFDGPTVGVICAEVVDNDPDPLSRHLADESEAFDAWFSKATATDPDERHQSASELFADFRRAWREHRRSGRGRRPPRRKPRRERRPEGEAHVASLSPTVVLDVEERTASRPSRPSKARWLAIAALVGGLGALALTVTGNQERARRIAVSKATAASRAVMLDAPLHGGVADRASAMALSALAARMPD